MIRSSLGPDSAHAFALVSPQTGIAFQRRTNNGGTTDSTAGIYSAAPVWLRLDRLASTLTAYQSSDGVTWTKIGSQSISLPLTAYVGFAVASHDQVLTAKAAVTDVAVVEAPLPAGWASSVIGAPPVSGYAVVSGSSLAVAGAGADIYGVSDQFRYAYTRVSGDVDVSARVASVQYVDAWSKAGVMIRTSLNADAAHALMLVSAGNGLAFQRRPASGYQTLDTGGTGTAPAWVKLERRGSVVTAFRSADGVTWSLVGSQTLDLPASFYVGLAVTSHVPSVAATAMFDNVVVRPVVPVPNMPPVVALVSPADGATVNASTQVDIVASASDADGTITYVDLYVDGVKVASDTTSPYTFTWQSAATGTHTVKAIAYDDDGASATSRTANYHRDVAPSGACAIRGVRAIARPCNCADLRARDIQRWCGAAPDHPQSRQAGGGLRRVQGGHRHGIGAAAGGVVCRCGEGGQRVRQRVDPAIRVPEVGRFGVHLRRNV